MFDARIPVVGRWVAVMQHRRNDRNMVPAPWRTRCVRQGEIHEFILCRPDGVSGQPINDVSYLGFAEFATGGVVAVDDEFLLDGRVIGNLFGFDDTHMPNHFNILLAGAELVTGADVGLRVGDSCAFRPKQRY